MPARHPHRTVVLLALCLALGMSTNTLMITSAAVVGAGLAADRALATLPVALAFVGTMATTVPASLLMKRVGRRYGFLTGATLAATSAALASLGIWERSFPLFCVATTGLGAANAFVQYYRFAAADAADESFRSTAISLVMGGGVVAAVIGPNLATWAKDWVAAAPFTGTFLSLIGLQVLAMALLLFLDIPRPDSTERGDAGRGLREIARQPRFVVAVVGGMCAYMTMNLVMTATPLAVLDCNYVFADAAFVIQWHIIAMFAPAFVTGRLIRRVGVLPVMLAGAAMLGGTVAANVSGVDLHVNFLVGLVLLGVGWNFVFVGATTLLTTCYTPAEKAKTQAANDFIVFSSVAVSALSSGAIHSLLGWTAVNLVTVPLILAVTAGVVWLMLHERRAPAIA